MPAKVLSGGSPTLNEDERTHSPAANLHRHLPCVDRRDCLNCARSIPRFSWTVERGRRYDDRSSQSHARSPLLHARAVQLSSDLVGDRVGAFLAAIMFALTIS